LAEPVSLKEPIMKLAKWKHKTCRFSYN